MHNLRSSWLRSPGNLDLRFSRLLTLALALVMVTPLAAKDLRISIPKRTKPTAAQKYNQEGVSALKKNHIKEAKKLFYKAYLLDPDDPFTLNNLGYVAELEGEVDRAQRYYDLSAENASEAVIDKSTQKDVEGQPAVKVAGMAEEGPLEVNRLNVQAISLLQKDRPFEAEAIIKKALALDPNNAFALNNMGFAQEKQGELKSALDYYRRAAQQNTKEKVIVTAKSEWRGKPITEVAARNARKIEKTMGREETPEEQVARLNLRGVSALNRNDRKSARDFFQQAYKLNPDNAFTLNNMGYLAELEGDRESANFFYSKAQAADRANATVGVATKRDAEGRKLEAVADNNDNMVATRMQQELAAKRRARANQPVVLHGRDGTVISNDRPEPEGETPENPNDNPQNNQQGSEPQLLTRPSNNATQPGATTAPNGNADQTQQLQQQNANPQAQPQPPAPQPNQANPQPANPKPPAPNAPQTTDPNQPK